MIGFFEMPFPLQNKKKKKKKEENEKEELTSYNNSTAMCPAT